MRMRLAILGVLCLLLSACGSIPLGTMWKMYRMGPEALFETNPEHVRVAVMSESWVLDREQFDWGLFSVDLELNDSGTYKYRFMLDDVSRLELAKLKNAPKNRRWRVYRITPEDLDEFQVMQVKLNDLRDNIEGKGGSLQIGVSFLGRRDREFWREAIESEESTSNETVDPEALANLDQREIPYRIDLQLDPGEGFFTLIKESMIPASWLGIEKQDDPSPNP